MSGRAPSLHGNYPASPLLRAPPTSAVAAAGWLAGGVGFHPQRRISQVPLLIFRRALSPNHPGKPGCCASRCLHSRYQTALSPGGKPLPTFVTRPLGFNAYGPRLRPSPFGERSSRDDLRGFHGEVALAPLRGAWSTCRASDLHGQHLTVDKISQALPGAPESAEFMRSRQGKAPHFQCPRHVRNYHRQGPGCMIKDSTTPGTFEP